MEYNFKHNDEFFLDFIESPRKFTLYEVHDIKFLEELLNDQSLSIKPSDRNKIINYIKNAKKQIYGLRRKAIPFEYCKREHSGKYFPKNSFQFMEKSLKTKIYIHDGYISLDIVNRGYSIINELAKMNNLFFPNINQLVTNREEVYREHDDYWYDSKCGFLDLILNSSYRDRQPKFVKNVIDEINYVKKVFRHPQYPHFSLSNIIEIYTGKILEAIAEYLVFNGITINKFYSLNGDEILFQPQKPFRIDDIEDFIFVRTGMNIKLH
uniref:Uncharacterized protein n=1 Tax=Panagrolaimus sp. ES5 TaxID=591445 RepID=A0AC34FY90_9BILA